MIKKITCFFIISSSFLCADISLTEFLNSYYLTPQPPSKLVFSLQKEYRNIAMELIINGENPNGLPIAYAVAYEDEELLRLMVDYGGDPAKNAAVDSGIMGIVYRKTYYNLIHTQTNPLFLAALTNKNSSITKILLDFGLNPFDLTDSLFFDKTPIGRVCYNGDLEKFLIILNYLSKEKLSLEDKIGRSLLHILGNKINCNENYFEIAKVLIENGAKIENQNYSALSNAVRQGNLKLVQFLLDLGSNPNYEPILGPSRPIISAWLELAKQEERKNNNENSNLKTILEKLIEAGLEINIPLAEVNHSINNLKYLGGETPLGHTMMYHLDKASRILLENGADLELKDRYQRTPLMLAAEMNFILGAKSLIEFGADPRNGWKQPVLLALEKKYIEMADLLIDAEVSFYR